MRVSSRRPESIAPRRSAAVLTWRRLNFDAGTRFIALDRRRAHFSAVIASTGVRSHLFVTDAAVVAKWSAPVARRLRAARHVRVVCHAHAACSPGQAAAAARARAAGASSFVHPGTALARSSAPRRVSRVGHVSARCVGESVNHVFIGYIDQTFAHHQHPQPCADQRSLSPRRLQRLQRLQRSTAAGQRL